MYRRRVESTTHDLLSQEGAGAVETMGAKDTRVAGSSFEGRDQGQLAGAAPIAAVRWPDCVRVDQNGDSS